MSSKKAQSMSLNVIIVAALALIVLVVLVAIFTGRIGVFNKGVSEAGKAELVKMKIMYGDCQPTANAENQFTSEFDQATSTEAKELSGVKFKEEINRCKTLSSEKGTCESGGCKWS